MPKERNPARDKAYELYRNAEGKVDISEIAGKLGLSAGTVRGWKSKDKWDEKMNGAFQTNGTERSERPKTKKGENTSLACMEDGEALENAGLTDKQQLFCLYYVQCFNATKAYRKAYGCDYRAAAASGSRMLKNVKIKEEISRLKQNSLNRELLTEEDIFQKYMDIAFADVTDYVEFGTEEVPVMSMHGPVEIKDAKTGKKKLLTKQVNVVRFKDCRETDGTLITEVKQGKDGASIKLADRMKALQWLSEHMDMSAEKQADDGFIEALNQAAGKDWADEED